MLTVIGILIGLIVIVAIHDLCQKKHAILRNFPVIGHFRYMLETIGPELRQYWVASDTEEKPYSRKVRAFVYSSAKGENNKIGFGSQEDYKAPGQIHIRPSMFPIPDAHQKDKLDPIVIGPKRAKPFRIDWPLAVSDMSFGALSEEAVRALSSGARTAGIHMGTGEGGLTPYHLEGVVYKIGWSERIAWLIAYTLSFFSKRWQRTAPPVRKVGGARIIVELGPAKFGFRTADGQLDLAKLKETCKDDQIGAVQIKLAQGAKPGQGGVLPAAKLTPEIAAIRGVPLGVDCVSPNCWSEFSDVPGLMQFVVMLQKELGKPVGFKFVIGSDDFIRQVAQYMKETGEGPDFMVVDGGEGGTGAAPQSLADHVGMPILHAIPIVDNALREFGVRDQVVLISSGKVATPADVFIHLSLGSDACNIGRAFLLSIGCIQSMRCHTNHCPTGITTQNKWLRRGLNPAEKYNRAANYAKTLQHELVMLLRSVGVRHSWELNRGHLTMVVSPGNEKPMNELFPYPQGGSALRQPEYARSAASQPTVKPVVTRA